MKAVVCTRYGAPEVLEIRELKKPFPKDNEVLIKIHATTVTVADFRVRSFTIPLSFWIPARLMLGITKPRKAILGIELAGEIEALGKDVTRFKKGDQVFAATLPDFGCYAEYNCIPEDGVIAIKPSNVTYEVAAAIPVGALTALHYLRIANIKKGQKVLVYGASGSVGTYAVQLAKHFGAEVTGVCSSANLSMVKSLQADKVLDYTASNFIDSLEMYDITLIAIDQFSFSNSMKSLKKNGVYLNVTTPVKSFEMLLTSIISSKKIIVGQSPPKKFEDLLFLKKLVEDGVLKPVIDRTYGLDEIVEAHRYVEQGHKKGNVVIKVYSGSSPT